MTRPIPVSVLGATGVVGQRFVARLANHPGFELLDLAASERSSGKPYAEACSWHLGGAPYAGQGQRLLVPCDPERLRGDLVFSALGADVALELEPALARRGVHVFSNASAHREVADVPLLVPEVNPDHLELLEQQRRQRGWSGSIVCNPNCTTAVLCMVLAPLQRAFGLEALSVTSLQAASGAGRPGVPSLDLLGNVVPYIPGEEEKVASEARKLLGSLTANGVRDADLALSASCTRVPVLDGHTMTVSMRLGGAPSPERVREVLSQWRAAPQELNLPSAPTKPLVLHSDPTRPQPRLDVESDAGMPVHVGRVRPCEVLGLRMTVMGHNVERGAAGGSVLNAELARARGWI